MAKDLKTPLVGYEKCQTAKQWYQLGESTLVWNLGMRIDCPYHKLTERYFNLTVKHNLAINENQNVAFKIKERC